MDNAKKTFVGMYAANKPEPTTKEEDKSDVTEDKKEKKLL